MRWTIRYIPEFEKRWNRPAKGVNPSERVDETYINVGGRWSHLFRAVLPSPIDAQKIQDGVVRALNPQMEQNHRSGCA
jgi:transposase-like protein